MRYYANTFTYKIEQESDGWFSIYRYNENTSKYMPIIQAKDFEHAKSYCDMCEPIVVSLDKL